MNVSFDFTPKIKSKFTFETMNTNVLRNRTHKKTHRTHEVPNVK